MKKRHRNREIEIVRERGRVKIEREQWTRRVE